MCFHRGERRKFEGEQVPSQRAIKPEKPAAKMSDRYFRRLLFAVGGKPDHSEFKCLFLFIDVFSFTSL